MKFQIGFIFLATIFVLGACSGNDEQSIDNNKEQNDVADEESQDATEDEAEEPFTISNMEATPFEDIEGKTAVKLYPEEIADPYDLERLRWKIYYGNNEFITFAPDEGVFRYDLKENQVIWQNDTTVTSSFMHDGYLYGTQMEESNSYASIGVIDLEDGNIVKMYEEEEYRTAGYLHFLDQLMLFAADPIDKQDNLDKELIVYDLDSDSIKWTTPVSGLNDQQAIDLGDGILLFNEFENQEDHVFADDTAYIYDKQTGEEMYHTVAKAIRRTPVVNEEGVYFADHNENTIRLYDYAGNLKTELQSEIGFGLYQLIKPIATEEAFILADNEGIVWYDTDLSTIQHRVELGESTIRYMKATDDRVFAIVSESTEEDEDAFYTISLDIHTGEVYEKVALETSENSVAAQHVYNNKYHFSVINVEEEREVYYVFSGEDVNKPMIQ